MYGRYFSSTFVFRLLALLLWMTVIFAFSSMPGNPSASAPDIWYFLERKSAHVFEYFLLFLLSVRFFKVLYFRQSLKNILFLSLVFCLAYAATDELHQFFSPFRGAKLSDILFDALGASLGFLLFFFCGLFKKKK